MSPFLDTRAVYPPCLPCCYPAVQCMWSIHPSISKCLSIKQLFFTQHTRVERLSIYIYIYIYVAQGSAAALENYVTCPWSQHVPIGNPDPRNLIATALLKKLACTASILKLNDNLFTSKTKGNHFLIALLVQTITAMKCNA